MKLAFARSHSFSVFPNVTDSKQTTTTSGRVARPRNPMMDKLVSRVATSDAFSYEVASVAIQEAMESAKKR